MDYGSVRRNFGERDCRLRRRGQFWREQCALVGQRRGKSLARKWVAAGRSDSWQRLHTLPRMRIRRDERCNGFHGRRKRRLRKFHGEVRRRLAFRGFGGLGIFEFLAAVTAGDFSQTFRSGFFFGVDRRLNRFVRRCGRIIFAGFDARAILLRKNLRLL